MDDVDYVIKDSTCPLLIIVPDGRIKYEWNANTEIVNDIWLDTTKTVSVKFGDSSYSIQDNSVFLTYPNTNITLSLPDNINGFTLYFILRNYNEYNSGGRYPKELPGLTVGNKNKNISPIIYRGDYSSTNILNNSSGKLGLYVRKTLIEGGYSNTPIFTFSPYDEIKYLINNNSFYTFGIDISNEPLLVYCFRCSKSKNLSYDSPPNFSIFVKNKKFYDNLLSPYSTAAPKESTIDLTDIYIQTERQISNGNYGEVKYIGLQPSGEISDEEILENMQYLTKKFKLDQEG